MGRNYGYPTILARLPAKGTSSACGPWKHDALQEYDSLPAGNWTFAVRAADAAGNVEAQPQSAAPWQVEMAAFVQITGGDAGATITRQGLGIGVDSGLGLRHPGRWTWPRFCRSRAETRAPPSPGRPKIPTVMPLQRCGAWSTCLRSGRSHKAVAHSLKPCMVSDVFGLLNACQCRVTMSTSHHKKKGCKS